MGEGEGDTVVVNAQRYHCSQGFLLPLTLSLSRKGRGDLVRDFFSYMLEFFSRHDKRQDYPRPIIEVSLMVSFFPRSPMVTLGAAAELSLNNTGNRHCSRR